MDGRVFGCISLLIGMWSVQAAAAQPRLEGPEAAGEVAAAQPGPKNGGEKPKDDLFKLPIENLGQIAVTPTASALPVSLQQQVSTVSRQESSVAHSPAAVFVITQEMIRRSGATSLPELFRMVPGLDVARVDSSRWAISARGFNSRLSDKMLVQIDGRTIYNPIFSGVFWEAHDMLLQDIERIEVIRGPGATVWGQNAVNGVINIITKRAQDTQGGLLIGGGGTQSQGMGGFRYGAKLGDDLYYRVWGKWNTAGTFVNQSGPPFDDWRQGHTGLRFDWQPTCYDTFTLQGEYFQGSFGRTDIRSSPIGPLFVANRIGDDKTMGGNVIGKWRHEVGEKSDWTLLVFFDNFRRDISTGFTRFNFNTYDIDFQQQFPLTERQQLIYGLGYRLVDVSFGASNFDGGFTLTRAVPRQQFNYYSAFIQDEITLVPDRWFFTAGCKFLENDLTGFEYQPTARLLFSPDKEHSAWAAVSRAVRTPSYSDHYIINTALPTFPAAQGGAPVFGRTIGDTNTISEDLVAYELGYRAQPTENFVWDVAGFFNVYRNLITTRPGPTIPGPVAGTFIVPALRANGVTGESFGFELAANWKIAECWRLYGNYTFFNLQLHPAPGLSPLDAAEDQNPRNQIYLQSSWDLGRNIEFDLMARYIDVLPGFASAVPAYFSLDARLAWRPRPNLELAVIGQSLLTPSHLEAGAIARVPFPLVEIPRGVFGMLTYRW